MPVETTPDPQEMTRTPLPDPGPPSAVDREDEDADPVGSGQPTLPERLQSDSQVQRG